jgi:RNA polymerase sigma factor (sigma-70 family)
MATGAEAQRTPSDAFDVLCRGVFPRLVSALTLHTGDRELARDLAQEALARAWRDWDRVQHLDAPEAWVFRTALNLASSWFRRVRTARSKAPMLAVVAEEQGSDPAVSMALRDAVGALPRRQRTAVIARYQLDLSITETATAMGCAEGTVRALTAQGTASLRAALGRDFQEGEQ